MTIAIGSLCFRDVCDSCILSVCCILSAHLSIARIVVDLRMCSEETDRFHSATWSIANNVPYDRP